MFCNHCKNSIQDGQLLLVKEIGNIACRYITRKLKIQECIRVLHRAGYPILYGSTLWVSWNFLFFIFVSFIFYDWNKKNCFYKLKLFIEWKLKMKEKKYVTDVQCPVLNLPEPLIGKIEGARMGHGAAFECPAGFKLKGAAGITCQYNGERLCGSNWRQKMKRKP